MLDQRRTTNILLLIIAIPLVFYLLHILSFIFIPLIFSMFIALLFLPLMRFFEKRKFPKFLSIAIVIFIVTAGLKIGIELIKLSSREILASKTEFYEKTEVKIDALKEYSEKTFRIVVNEEENPLSIFFKKENIGSTVGFVNRFLTTLLMTIFFAVLWLAESINFHNLLNNTVLKRKHTSIKAFRRIESDLIKFIKVKFFVSLMTGIFTGLMCYFFDVSFPIFWGLFGFVINFVQMVGSFVTVILCSLFAFVELESTTILLAFIASISGVQVLFGAILEPILMGKSFKINVIAVLVMLMLWGFIWGIPGLIMAIPITVFVKIILDQFPNSKVLASLLSG